MRPLYDIEYYNAINIRTATYIRNKFPDKLMLVNTSGYLPWGDTFTQEQLKQISELGRFIDVFIDVGSHGIFVDKKDRPNLIRDFKASFGTSNGLWIYPPQRWNRDRWLIPHFQDNYTNLKDLYNDGGRSCELYLAPLVNPGVEITFLCNGLFCMDPTRSLDDILEEAVNRLYSPKSAEHAKMIADLFKGAEDLFFNSYHPERDRSLDDSLSDGVENVFCWSQKCPDRAVPGEVFLERLFGIGPGFPCYLTVYFNAEGRRKYKNGMIELLKKAEAISLLEPSVRTKHIVRCIENTLADIALVERTLK